MQQGRIGVAVQGIALGILAGPALAAIGVVAVDHIVGQGAQLGLHVAGGKVLEMAKADEAGRGPRDHGCGFHGLAVHRGGRGGQAQRARGGNAQGVHGFAAQELADGGAQHGPAIAAARIRGAACALELQLPARGGLAQVQGTAIAQLPGPHAELVAAVDAGIGLAAGQHGVAAEGLQGRLGRHEARGQADQLRHLFAVRHPGGGGQRGGGQVGQKRRAQGGKAGLPVRGGGTVRGMHAHHCGQAA